MEEGCMPESPMATGFLTHMSQHPLQISLVNSTSAEHFLIANPAEPAIHFQTAPFVLYHERAGKTNRGQRGERASVGLERTEYPRRQTRVRTWQLGEDGWV